MLCPADQTELIAHPCRDEVIHECDSCRGLWIGIGAQKECFAVHQRTSLSTARAIKFDHHATRQLSCPTCREHPRLDTFRVEKVEIDRCPQCHGVWLDHGEFQAILDLKAKMARRPGAEAIADGALTVADPMVTEAALHAIEHAGDVSREAATTIFEIIGDVLGGLFSSF